MDRAQKAEAVAEMHELFQGGETLVMTHYSGLTVAQLTKLRQKLRESGGSLKVTKNRLAKRALEGTRFENMVKLFAGPTAVAVSKDPVAAAKVVWDFAKENEKLIIVGGAFAGQVLDKKDVENLAKLPSMDELRAKFLALLVTPATRVATILQVPASQLARVTKAYADKG